MEKEKIDKLREIETLTHGELPIRVPNLEQPIAKLVFTTAILVFTAFISVTLLAASLFLAHANFDYWGLYFVAGLVAAVACIFIATCSYEDPETPDWE